LVSDRQTLAPLPSATVILLGSDPLQGTTTGVDGHFKLSGIPIGKHQLQVSYVGYQTVTTDPLIVSSGKETMITVMLDEAVLSAAEVEIKGDYRKYDAINKMATVSIRGFSVDETFRFPGSYNDPARMASNFAGVTSGIDNRNDIIVRGNSPMGLQWRLDGIEIPNPNHFAAVGTTGGPVTILNSNLLTNSDFLTGAFPAEYGNTIAGIFDMRLRNGNNEQHEFWGEIGWNGLEFGAEGPLSRKSGAAYIAAYRYSLLQFLGYLGIDLGMIPRYQDLNLKLTLPTRKAGIFSVSGLGGISYIELFDSRKKSSDWTFPDYGEDLSNGSDLGVLGLSHQISIRKSLLWKTQLSLVFSRVYTRIDTFSNVVTTPAPYAGERSSEFRYTMNTGFVKKFSSSNTLESGITWDLFLMDFADSVMWKGSFIHHTGSRESMQLLRMFTQWKHRFSDRWYVTTGVFGSFLTLNNSWSLEPRFGLEWMIHKKHVVTFGTGLYSQMQPRVVYFLLSGNGPESRFQANKTLDFNRSFQVATGYQFLLNENLRFRTELYYQYLYDLPVKQSIPSYCLINQGHEFFLDRQYSDSLLNAGSGENYGIECTFERFFRKNYYFLLTAFLFQSTFRGYDGITRNSAFNVNYGLNAVGGYEFVIGKRKWGVMSFGLRATWAGGNPYVPFDPEATVQTGEPVYDWSASYEPRYPEYKRLSLRFGIKRNLPQYNIEFLVDLQYRTNFTNVYLQRIDPKTGEIRTYFSLIFSPWEHGGSSFKFPYGKR
jgi:hypothetical protein